MVTHPDPQQILIIGGGDGGTLKETLRYPIERVKMVEIDPDVITVAKKYFPWLLHSLEDKRTEILTAEGREYLDTSQDNYDIVLVDSSESVGPSKILHERSFFEQVRDRLAPVPTYPGGNWCCVYLSRQVDPFALRREPPPGLKYYNQAIHKAAFALPNYLQKLLK